jgi:hypothetical protein
MSAHVIRFADLVEMIDRLPLDQRESLVDVVRRRIADDERRRVAASIRSARREHARGRSKPTTPDELMREILG